MPRRKPKISMKAINKLHVDLAKSLIEGKSEQEIELTIIATEAIGKTTKHLINQFDRLFVTKLNEYCELMKNSPKVYEMFQQLMQTDEELAAEASKLFRDRFNKSHGFLSFLRKNEVEQIRANEKKVSELRAPLRKEIQDRFDAYHPTVIKKIINNIEVQNLLSEFPVEIELEFGKKTFEKSPISGNWSDFFENFKTAYGPKVIIKSSRTKWLVEFNFEVVKAMKAQLPLIKRKNAKARLKAQASKNKDGQRHLMSKFRTQTEYSFQLERYDACPYCELKFESSSLNSNVQLDHIYPVSKGGHSVIENLVFICSECNSKKSDLTLAIFCSKVNLDRDKVTNNLLKLGKDV